MAGLTILRQTEKLRSSLIDEFMNRYNFIRPHGAFDIERLETPAFIYYQRLPKKEVIMDTALLENIRGVK